MSKKLLCVLLFIIPVCTFFSCRKPGSGESVKFQLYYAQGENLFIANCANCHQRTGEGLGLVYPPVNKSDYMDKKFPEVVCLIRDGKRGEITVNGNIFNQPMFGLPNLTELEMAELVTYLYNSGEHQRGIVEVDEIRKALADCK